MTFWRLPVAQLHLAARQQQPAAVIGLGRMHLSLIVCWHSLEKALTNPSGRTRAPANSCFNPTVEVSCNVINQSPICRLKAKRCILMLPVRRILRTLRLDLLLVLCPTEDGSAAQRSNKEVSFFKKLVHCLLVYVVPGFSGITENTVNFNDKRRFKNLPFCVHTAQHVPVMSVKQSSLKSIQKLWITKFFLQFSGVIHQTVQLYRPAEAVNLSVNACKLLFPVGCKLDHVQAPRFAVRLRFSEAGGTLLNG